MPPEIFLAMSNNRSLKVRKFNAALSTMCNAARLDREDTKRELIHRVSEGKFLHTEDLTNKQLDQLIDHVNECTNFKATNAPDRMRKKIIHYCHLMRWYTDDGKLDWERINAFCKKSGHAHKNLNDYTTKELPTLVSQWEEVYKSFLRKK
jgi:hypothetical protein